jgi:alkanesulfonate monooxygenase SsuD/methylene tetrahydromethanopterin reductase-like flavin-dependent oxidoreductase (luciferase family)
MDLLLEDKLRIGLITIHRRTEPATGPWLPSIDELRELVERVDSSGYDSLWCGDHISFPMAILDPLLQLAQAAVVSRRLMFGTSVYLLPLRHPVPVAKQVATLDHLTEGRFIFGVGVGGEFAREYEACGVPLKERGARLGEAIPLLRKLWSGEPVTYEGSFLSVLQQRAHAAACAANRRAADLVRWALGCRARPRWAPRRRLDCLRGDAGDVQVSSRQDRGGGQIGGTG